MEPVGYDYGIRPKVLVVGDYDFLAPLQRSFQGLGYSGAKGPDQIIAEPVLFMLFGDELDAQIAFSHFRRWSEGSGSGDAVAINFIEFDSGEYGMSISPDVDRLITRSLGEILRHEVDPLVQVISNTKILPQQNPYYHAFKAVVQNTPFQLVPATNMGDMPELAITKTEVGFYSEHDAAARKNGMFQLPHSEEPSASDATVVISEPPRPAKILERRLEQLRRFYPVTLERLRYDKAFEGVREELKVLGFAEWQVIQAACNISLGHRAPHLFSEVIENITEQEGDEPTVGTGRLRILEYLLSQYEEANLTLPPPDELTLEPLVVQIVADSRYLLNSVQGIDVMGLPSEELQHVLVQQGFIVEE